MFTITENAKQKLRDMRIKTGAGRYTFRLRQAPGRQIGMVLDEVTPRDRVFAYMGLDVLAVDGELLRRLDGWRIDTRQENGTSRLIIDRAPPSRAREGGLGADENGRPPLCRWYDTVDTRHEALPAMAHS